MELVDMLDLGSSAARCESSSLSLSTKNEIGDHEMQLNQLKVPSVVHGSGTLPISIMYPGNDLDTRVRVRWANWLKPRTVCCDNFKMCL